MMNKEFIPYEQALALKELGFEEMCMRLYVNGRLSPQVDEGQFNHDWDIVSAPLYQQAFRWFRDKYNLLHTVNLNIDLSNNDKVYIYTIEDHLGSIGDRNEEYNTYEEAELACLRKLIERLESKEDVSLLQEVINFLIDNEQYGDDWKEHIDALNKLLNQNKEDEENINN